jgi:Tol biopolymer transport system component
MRTSTTGGAAAQLTQEGDNGLPTWSPDGRSIAFVTNRSGSWALWVMNFDGSSQRQLAVLEPGFGRGPIDWTDQRVSWGN